MIAKQLINVVGALVVVAALLGGVFLIALPLYSASESTSADAQRVEDENAIFDAQVAGLRADAERYDEIAGTVADLRTQIPAEPRTDDVFEIVGAAAAETGATVVSITAADTVPWAPRVGADTDEGVAVAPASDQAATPAPDPAEGTVPDASDTTDAATDEAAPAENARAQVSFTISVEAADPAQAVAFVDALGRGPRLLAIEHTSVTSTGDAYDVSVTAITFVRDDS